MSCRPSLFQHHLCHFGRRSLMSSFFLLIVFLGTVSSSASKRTAAVSSTESTVAETTTVETSSATTLSCNQLLPTHTWNDVLSCDGDKIEATDSNVIVELDISNALQEDFMQIFNSNKSKSVNHVSIVASQSNTLTEIRFEKMLLFNFFKREFKLLDNPILQTVHVVMDTSEKKKLHVEIRGNKMLTEDSLTKLKEIKHRDSSSYIQELGECRMLSSHLGHFDNLKHCKYFDKDLVINGNTQGNPSRFQFTEIRGCLKIMNTQLTNVDFIDSKINTSCSENEIIGNAKLCLSSEKKANLTNLLGTVKFDKNQACKDICTPEWAKQKHKGVKCQIIEGDLLITGISDVEELDYLENVEEIYGRLDVFGNTFKKYTILPKLKKVEHKDNTKPAIYIHNNDNLESISLPALEKLSIPSDSQEAVLRVENNNKDVFVFPEKEVKRLELLGKIHVPRPVIKITKAPDNTTETTVAPGGEGGGSGSKEDLEKKKEEAKKEENSNALALGLGIGLTGLGLLVILIVVGVIVFVVLSKKKKNNNNKKKKKTKKEPKSETVVHEEEDRIELRVPEELDEEQRKEAMASNTLPEEGIQLMNNAFDPLGQHEIAYFHLKSEAIEEEQLLRNFALQHRHNDIQKITVDDGQKFIAPKKNPPEDKGDVKRIFPHRITYINYSINVAEQIDRWKIIKDIGSEFRPRSFLQMHMEHNGKIKYSSAMAKSALRYFLHSPLPKDQSQLQRINGPCHIVGDIEGSMFDLQAILSMDPLGFADKRSPMWCYKYVFCGNYMNGSIYDLQTVLFLLVFSAYRNSLNPDQENMVILIRGTNEYGKLAQELVENAVKQHFITATKKDAIDEEGIVNLVMEAYKRLPLAVLVSEKLLVVNGGISCDQPLADDKGQISIDSSFGAIPFPLEPSMTPYAQNLVMSLLYSEPSLVFHPQTEYNAGCYFNEGSLYRFLQDLNLNMVVTGRSKCGFALSMKNRLASLKGCFDPIFAKHGYGRVLKNRGMCSSIAENSEKLPSAGVLRVNGDGSLTMMMYRHLLNVCDMGYNMTKITRSDEFNIERKKTEWASLLGNQYGGNVEKVLHLKSELDELDHIYFILEQKLRNMTFAESVKEFKRLRQDPPLTEQWELHGLHKQVVKGDAPWKELKEMPCFNEHEHDETKTLHCKNHAWMKWKGTKADEAEKEFRERVKVMALKYNHNFNPKRNPEDYKLENVYSPGRFDRVQGVYYELLGDDMYIYDNASHVRMNLGRYKAKCRSDLEAILHPRPKF